MYYPLMFEPVFKEMIWGGVKLRDIYRRSTPFERTGESWDISCRENEMGTVSNGEFASLPFISVIKKDPAGFMGKKYRDFSRFPLLVKLIDAGDFLSVQVHPGDAYAQRAENYPLGKNEMWYILSAEPESYLYIGLKDGVTKEMFKNALKSGCVENLLNKLYVSRGDLIDIPAGLLHAVGKGIVLAEIQQNSDITYRVYDYNRKDRDGKPRELHIEKSLDVIDFSNKFKKEAFALPASSGQETVITECIKNDYFTVRVCDINGDFKQSQNEECFSILTCAGGEAVIRSGGYSAAVSEGDSLFMPAALGEYEIKGNCRLLESYA